LTFKTLVDLFIGGNAGLQSYIEDYIHAQATLQTITNPSGDFFTGAGLAEPKFNIDGTRLVARRRLVPNAHRIVDSTVRGVGRSGTVQLLGPLP
jgi:hypothetical protein